MVHVRRAPPLHASRASRRLRGASPESIEVISDDDVEVVEGGEAAPATAVAAATAATAAARRASKEEPSSSGAAPRLAPASALEEAICGICLELVAAAHAVGGCGHVFCGACLGKSIQASLLLASPLPSSAAAAAAPPRCPQCRAPISAAPTRVRMVDNIVACLSASASANEGNDEERASVSARVAAFDGSGGGWANGGGGNGSSRVLDGAAVAGIFARLSNSSRGRQPPPSFRMPARVEAQDDEEEGEDSESDGDEDEDGDDEEDPPLSNRSQPRNAEESRARAVRFLQETVNLQRAAAVLAIERVGGAGGGGGGGGGGGAAFEQVQQELRLQRLEQQMRGQNRWQQQRVSQQQRQRDQEMVARLREQMLRQQQQQQQR